MELGTKRQTRVTIETDEHIFSADDATLNVSSRNDCLEFTVAMYRGDITTKMITKEPSMPTNVELYSENLLTLKSVIEKLDELLPDRWPLRYRSPSSY